tara:strand:- start:1375 stop:1767 length:393 start_codon:yes stop_codon:yes gene_type:complete
MGIKLLLFLPFLEIILFILFGDLFGFLNVIFFIILSGILGLWLLFPKNKINNFSDLANEPSEWLFRRFAGILLIIPGFFTDLVGFLLLIKTLRNFVWFLLPEQLKPKKKKDDKNDLKDNIIEAEYKNLDD